jgi:hypothetical protein
MKSTKIILNPKNHLQKGWTKEKSSPAAIAWSQD